MRGPFVFGFPYTDVVMEVFLERGNQLALSRKLMARESDYTAALALVSIHCGIAFNDALLFKLTGRHISGPDHMASVRMIKKQCSSKKIGANGLRHLEELVKAKTKVSYSNEKTTYEAADRLAVASERFETWVRPLLQ
jgi:hypothetical protein